MTILDLWSQHKQAARHALGDGPRPMGLAPSVARAVAASGIIMHKGAPVAPSDGDTLCEGRGPLAASRQPCFKGLSYPHQ